MYKDITKSLFTFCKARARLKKWKENHITKATKIPKTKTGIWEKRKIDCNFSWLIAKTSSIVEKKNFQSKVIPAKSLHKFKSSVPKFPHAEAKRKQKSWNWESDLSKVKTSFMSKLNSLVFKMSLVYVYCWSNKYPGLNLS